MNLSEKKGVTDKDAKSDQLSEDNSLLQFLHDLLIEEIIYGPKPTGTPDQHSKPLKD